MTRMTRTFRNVNSNATNATNNDSMAAAPDGDSRPQEESTPSFENVVEYSELKYGMESFHAIITPVFLTMVFSALSVIYISTPESRASFEASISASYTVFDPEEGDSTSSKLGQSLVNGLVIVGVVCCATFVIVLLYKYRCMKCLIGYMVFASTAILGLLSSTMFQVAIDRYQLTIDVISFYWFIVQFAIVGVMAIFAPLGIPSYITQGYLIITSVIVAWQLSHFDEWTAWMLLILLALYDLFAVLTPCGPLKALVKLMQKDNAPNMPGLLYEANLPTSGGTASATGNRNTSENGNSNNNSTRSNHSPTDSQSNSSSTETQQNNDQPTQMNNAITSDNGAQNTEEGNAENEPQLPKRLTRSVPHREVSNATEPTAPTERTNLTSYSSGTITTQPSNESEEENNQCQSDGNDRRDHQDDDQEDLDHEDDSIAMSYPSHLRISTSNTNNSASLSTRQQNTMEEDEDDPKTGRIPFALAKLYRLPAARDPQPPWIISERRRQQRVLRPAIVVSEEAGDDGSVTSTSYLANNDDDSSVATVTFAVEQMFELMDVRFPRNGGHVEVAPPEFQRGQTHETRWAVYDRNGERKRVLFVNRETGKVFEDLSGPNNPDGTPPGTSSRKEKNSIKLGLGDFIFYSILVSKAALYSYATFAACTLAILTGLGLTLLILALVGKALPALPISIAFGVLFFLQSRYIMEPWIQEIFIQQTYV